MWHHVRERFQIDYFAARIYSQPSRRWALVVWRRSILMLRVRQRIWRATPDRLFSAAPPRSRFLPFCINYKVEPPTIKTSTEISSNSIMKLSEKTKNAEYVIRFPMPLRRRKQFECFVMRTPLNVEDCFSNDNNNNYMACSNFLLYVWTRYDWKARLIKAPTRKNNSLISVAL